MRSSQWMVFGILALTILISGCGQPTQPSTDISDSKFICDYNAYDCADLGTHAHAQEVFEYCGGVNNDIHHLDADGDGVACELSP